VTAEESAPGVYGEGHDGVVHRFVGMPEFEGDENRDDYGQRRVVAFAGRACIVANFS
jgi:hypothetical protein